MGAYISVFFPVNLSGRGDPLRLDASMVNSDVFLTLDVQPSAGRVFTAEDDRVGGANVVLLSHGLALALFGAAADAVGQTVSLDNQAHTIVGIMPASFAFPSRDTQLWRPLRFSPALLSLRSNHLLYVVARLRDGVSIEEARADMDVIAGQLQRAYPKDNARSGIAVANMRDMMSPQSRTLVLAVFGAAFCLMLIACTNLPVLVEKRHERLGRGPDARRVTGARDLDHLEPAHNARHPLDGFEAAIVLADDGQHGQRGGPKTVTRNLIERQEASGHRRQHLGIIASEQGSVQRGHFVIRWSILSGRRHPTNEPTGVFIREALGERQHLRRDDLQVLSLPSGTKESHGHEAARVSDEELVGDRSPHRVADDVGALDMQAVEEADHVSDHLQPILAGIERLSALPMTPAVHGDHAIAGRLERLHHAWCFPVSRVGAGKPVKQHDRHAASFVHVVDLDAVGVKGFGRTLLGRAGRRGDNEDARCQQADDPRSHDSQFTPPFLERHSILKMKPQPPATRYRLPQGARLQSP